MDTYSVTEYQDWTRYRNGELIARCSSLKELEKLYVVHVPWGTTEIPDYAFKNCQQIKEVIFPSSLETIGKQAFYNCTNLKAMHCCGTSQVKFIGSQAFFACSSLSVHPQINELFEGKIPKMN